MTALDKKARKTAQDLLKKFGKNAQYRREVAGAYDEEAGQITGSRTDFYSVKVFLDKVTTGELESGLATVDDVKILLAASAISIIPQPNDLVVADKTYSVKKNMPTWSGEEIALHNLICVVR